MTLRLTPLDTGNLAPLKAALMNAGLPTADLCMPGRLFFRFDDGALVGYSGIEGGGADRLIRSLVVVPSRCGEGLGRAVLAITEEEARKAGVRRLHLLTTTASEFFQNAGYRVADRTAAPAVIAESEEFISLCPASASYLQKEL